MRTDVLRSASNSISTTCPPPLLRSFSKKRVNLSSVILEWISFTSIAHVVAVASVDVSSRLIVRRLPSIFGFFSTSLAASGQHKVV